MDLLVCTSEIAVSEVYTESEPAGEEDVKMWKSEHYQQSELRRQQIFLHYKWIRIWNSDLPNNLIIVN